MTASRMAKPRHDWYLAMMRLEPKSLPLTKNEESLEMMTKGYLNFSLYTATTVANHAIIVSILGIKFGCEILPLFSENGVNYEIA
jgi:hypothetical protein